MTFWTDASIAYNNFEWCTVMLCLHYYIGHDKWTCLVPYLRWGDKINSTWVGWQMCGSWRRRCFVLATSIPKKRLRIVRQLGQRASRTTYKKDNCKRTSRPNKHSILPPEFSIPFTICLTSHLRLHISTWQHLHQSPSPRWCSLDRNVIIQLAIYMTFFLSTWVSFGWMMEQPMLTNR